MEKNTRYLSRQKQSAGGVNVSTANMDGNVLQGGLYASQSGRGLLTVVKAKKVVFFRNVY